MISFIAKITIAAGLSAIACLTVAAQQGAEGEAGPEVGGGLGPTAKRLHRTEPDAG